MLNSQIPFSVFYVRSTYSGKIILKKPTFITDLARERYKRTEKFQFFVNIGILFIISNSNNLVKVAGITRADDN